MKIVYKKLVRDRIPEIIRASGKSCEVRVLDREACLDALDAKLDEELAEFRAGRDIEELADLLEVIRALAAELGCPPEELERIRAEKASARGAFERRLLLEAVSED